MAEPRGRVTGRPGRSRRGADPSAARRPVPGVWRRARRPPLGEADRPTRCPAGCELVWLLPAGESGEEAIAACGCTLARTGRRRAGQPRPPCPIWRLAAPGGIPRLVPVFASQAPLTWRLAVALLRGLAGPVTDPSARPG